MGPLSRRERGVVKRLNLNIFTVLAEETKHKQNGIISALKLGDGEEKMLQ